MSILPLLEQTHNAASQLRMLPAENKQGLILKLADILRSNRKQVIAENKKDADKLEDNNPRKDRLVLNEERIDGLIQSLEDIAALPDPAGHIISSHIANNGLAIQKITVPVGVVGVIYESRPNVTVDVAALCLRSGNAVVLKGGSEAQHSNEYLTSLIHLALKEFNIPVQVVTLLPPDRKQVEELLNAVKYVDIIIPRGSQQLIDFVRTNSKVPTIETGAGVCHSYITKDADLEKARNIVVNAKVSRPSVCNALDTIIVDKQVAGKFLPMLIDDFKKYNVEVFADEYSYSVLNEHGYKMLQQAGERDFGKEFLDFKCSVKTVEGLSEALGHIRQYSSRHSEAIISENETACTTFLNEVDAAAVYANASTRFTDGSCFGLGAEIGISTQKLHARGPFALEKLVTEKWVVKGNGQVRW